MSQMEQTSAPAPEESIEQFINRRTSDDPYEGDNLVDSSEPEEYSLVRHLAMIAGGAEWRSVNLAVFSAYFDASGSEKDQPAVATAGYVAGAEAWISFEGEWVARLHQDGLSYFRTSDFNSHTGEFTAGWKGNEDRKVSLITDLVEIIRANVGRQFGSVVKIADINRVFNSEQRKKFNVSAYSLTARACAGALRTWTFSQHLRSLPEMIFENGDKDQDTKIRRLLLEDGFPEPLFRPKKTITCSDGLLIEAAVPLQAADLLAYELFDPTRKIASDGFIRRIKKTLKALDVVPGNATILLPASMKTILAGWENAV